MRVFKTRLFARFARKARISDRALFKAVLNAESGLIDADLGGGIIKQRIARVGGGKSGGFRTIIVFQKGLRSFFVYGFAKNERDNISDNDLALFREFANEFFGYDDEAIERALSIGRLEEVENDD